MTPILNLQNKNYLFRYTHKVNDQIRNTRIRIELNILILNNKIMNNWKDHVERMKPHCKCGQL